MPKWSPDVVRECLATNFPAVEAPYLESELQNTCSYITLICKKHGQTRHTAENIVRGGCGCKKCSMELVNERHKKLLSEFPGAEKFLTKLPPKNPEKKYFRKDLAEVLCPTHGEISMPIKSLLRGYGCLKCSQAKKGVEKRHSFEKYCELMAEKHLSKYSYRLAGKFLGAATRIHASCQKHGEWEVLIYNHLYNNTGCPKCSGVQSQGSLSLFSFVSSLAPDSISEYRMPNGVRADIFLPSQSIAIEFNGTYYHSTKFLPRNHHRDRRKYFESQGVRLVTIWEDEWPSSKTEAYLRNLLGSISKLMARKCSVGFVERGVARKFYEEHHLMGPGVTGECNVGLFFQGALVACSSYRKVFKNYELYRAAYLSGTQIVGGLSKMLSHFLRSPAYLGGEVVSYVDLDKFDGRSYFKAGFARDKETVSMSYSHRGLRLSRHIFKKSKIDDGSGRSEREIMESRGYYQCFNSGTLKVVLVSSPARLS